MTATDAKRTWAKAEREALEDAFMAAIARAGLPEPERQCMLIVGRKYRVDFCWREAHLVAEADGGVFRPLMGHTSISGVLRDMQKQNLLTLAGYRMLRFHVNDLADGSAVGMIRAALEGTQ